MVYLACYEGVQGIGYIIYNLEEREAKTKALSYDRSMDPDNKARWAHVDPTLAQREPTGSTWGHFGAIEVCCRGGLPDLYGIISNAYEISASAR